MPALYRPLSFIPEDSWLAAPYTTNNSEQKHHDANLDGRNLTLVGGVMVGLDYDARALELHNFTMSLYINPRHLEATDLKRTTRSLRASGELHMHTVDPDLC